MEFVDHQVLQGIIGPNDGILEQGVAKLLQIVEIHQAHQPFSFQVQPVHLLQNLAQIGDDLLALGLLDLLHRCLRQLHHISGELAQFAANAFHQAQQDLQRLQAKLIIGKNKTFPETGPLLP